MRCITTALVLIAVAMSVAGCEKYKLDKQMEELCKQDGGNKVYETIVLPADMFDESGYPFPGWRNRPKLDRLGTDYLYLYETKSLKSGDPLRGQGELWRSHIRIIRKSDSKLLGETVVYARSGGEGVVIGHPSSNSCPKTGGPIEKLVFVEAVTQGDK